MADTKQMDMLNGSLWNKILMFALPLAASSIMQQLFNSADVAVVGRFAGSRALAAVGSNGAVINLLVNIFVGLSVGANVVIARYIGREENEKASQASHTAVLLSVISGILVTLIGLVITKPLLKLMATPDDIIDLAVLYLRIYFLGMPFIMFYNFGSAILRSRGDTKRPFICLVTAGIINVLLNLFFVIVCHMSVAGVGLATVISNVVSACLLLHFLLHEKSAVKISVKKLKIHKNMLVEMAKIGLPAGLQGVVFSASNICVQSGFNSLGSDVVAGSAAGVNFEFFTYCMLNAFSQAAVTFTGQNYGAGKMDRCKKVTVLCISLGIVFTMAMSVTFILFKDTFVRLYVTDPKVVSIAIERMTFILMFTFLNVIMDVLSGSLRGMGYSLVPAVMAVLGVCGVRLLWVFTVFKKYNTFKTLLCVYPLSWAATAAAIAIAYFIVWHHVTKPQKPKN